MKYKKLQNIAIGLALGLTFFLGRESKTIFNDEFLLNNYYSSKINPETNLVNSKTHFLNTTLSINQKLDSVFRCGTSKIYHPTKSHGSFRNCKSKVTKIPIQRARNMGMRHCKCSG